MSILKKAEIGILLALMVCFASGCGNSVSEEDLTGAIEDQNVNQIIELITNYQEQGNKAELDAVVSNQFENLANSSNYDDFVFMEKVAKKAPDEELKQKLQDVLSDNADKKIIAFTTGAWERRDYTNEDGMVIDIKWADDNGTAIISSAKVKNNKDGFQDKDVKWRNAKIISKNEIAYEDLFKENNSSDYKQAYAKVDFDKNILICNITSGSNEEYAFGAKQVWIKKDVIDTSKEVLKDEDFIIVDKELWESDNNQYVEFGIDNDLINDNNLREKVNKMTEEDPNNNIEDSGLLNGMGDETITRKMVIDKYGYGHIVYQDPKNDKVYNSMSKVLLDDSKNYMCNGLISLITQSEYSAIYDTRKADKHMKMYFDSEGKLLAVIKYKGDTFTP